MLLRPSSTKHPRVSVLPLLCWCEDLKFIATTVKVGVTPKGI